MSTIKTNTIQPTQAGNNLIFANGTAVEKMRITDGGLVGVGTAAPVSPLHIKADTLGSVEQLRLEGIGTQSFMRFNIGGTNQSYIGHGVLSGAGTGMYLINQVNSPLFIGTSDNIRLTVTGDGDVGIGTAAPAAELDVAGNGQIWIRAGVGGGLAASAGAGLKLEYVSSVDSAKIQAYDYSTNTGKNIVLNSSGGNVGIGNVTPTEALHVNGSIKASTSLVLGSAPMAAPSGTAPIFGARAYGYIPSTIATATKPPYSENVASITRVSTNITKVTFSTPMPHAFYTVVGMSRLSGSFSNQPMIFISPAYLSTSAIQPNTVNEMYFSVWDNSTDSVSYNNIAETSFVIYC